MTADERFDQAPSPLSDRSRRSRPIGLPVLNNPDPPGLAPVDAPDRRLDPERFHRYERILLTAGPEGAVRRALLSYAGMALVNTPVLRLTATLNLQPKHRVLDLQAGRLSLLRFLAGEVGFQHRPVALESSTAALELARRDLEPDAPFELALGSPAALPFADEHFDLVIAPHIFHRLDDNELLACMSEVLRVLRPGGILTGWDFAPTNSRRLNGLHQWLLSRGPVPARLRGFGPLAYAASDIGFDRIERPLLPPFLFPPIPRTAILAQKARV